MTDGPERSPFQEGVAQATGAPVDEEWGCLGASVFGAPVERGGISRRRNADPVHLLVAIPAVETAISARRDRWNEGDGSS